LLINTFEAYSDCNNIICHAGLDPASSAFWIPASAGMTKKHTLKNVIPRPPIVVEGMLDRGIQGFFNLNTKDTYLFIMPRYHPLINRCMFFFTACRFNLHLLTLPPLFAKLTVSKEQGDVTMPKTLELPEVEFITNSEGKPKSVVLSIEDWRRINETLKIMSSRELMQSIRRAKLQLQNKTKLLSFKEVFDSL
jgi:hypothetical protein